MGLIPGPRLCRPLSPPAADGVYAVPIGGLIRHSAVEAMLATSAGAGQFDDVAAEELQFELLDPDDIAEVFWDLHAGRDSPEEVVGGGFARR